MNKTIKNDPLTEKIIACCFKVHSELGPGFSERIYHHALQIILKEKLLKYDNEKKFSVLFHNREIGNFKVDLIVGDKIVIEIKAVAGPMPKVFESQLISYLKSSNLHVGLLVNFGNDRCQIRRLMC